MNRNTHRNTSNLILAAVATLGLAGTSQAAAPADTAPASSQSSSTAQIFDDQSSELQSRAANSFPTYWIGEYPPYPPLGYAWRFLYRDYYGRAHWRLVVC